jgi:hypothetical protein
MARPVDRLNRAYSLVQQSSTGYRNDRSNSDYYRDELFTFFETCLHLRDWLWNDPAVGLTQEDAGKPYNAHDCLKLAHDIAIGSKHVVIGKPRVDPSARLVGQDVRVLVGTGASFTWRIEADGRVHDGYGLATECLQAWEIDSQATEAALTDEHAGPCAGRAD